MGRCPFQSHRGTKKVADAIAAGFNIPEVDVVITMGCNVRCPFLPAPTGRTGVWKIPAEKAMKPSRKPFA